MSDLLRQFSSKTKARTVSKSTTRLTTRNPEQQERVRSLLKDSPYAQNSQQALIAGGPVLGAADVFSGRLSVNKKLNILAQQQNSSASIIVDNESVSD